MKVLMDRARAAAEDARILIEAGRSNGAVSRAYYAMFYAARAALRSIDPELDHAKTHATVLRRFSRHAVLEKGVDADLGRLLRQAYEVRQDADYDGPGISIEQARRIVANADRFIAAMTVFIGSSPP